jgi:hypothetical protein
MYFCTGIWVLISICAANKELYVRERGAVHKPEDGRGTRSLCRPNILCQSRVRADVIKTISKEEPSTDPSTDVVFIKELDDDDSTFAFRSLVDGYVDSSVGGICPAKLTFWRTKWCCTSAVYTFFDEAVRGRGSWRVRSLNRGTRCRSLCEAH